MVMFLILVGLAVYVGMRLASGPQRRHYKRLEVEARGGRIEEPLPLLAFLIGIIALGAGVVMIIDRLSQ